MKIRCLGLVVLVVIWAAVAGVQTNAAGSRATGGCGTKLVFLVWPKGHPAIPRIAEFPEIRNPHVDVYRGFDSGYDPSKAAAYVVGGTPPPNIGRGGYFADCANYGQPFKRGTVTRPRVINREIAVKCTLPRSPVADVVFRPGGVADLYLHAAGKLFAHAHATKTTIDLTVPVGVCSLAPPPH